MTATALELARTIDLVAPATSPRREAALILDFETNGKNAGNVPTQLAYQVVDAAGSVVRSKSCFLKGARVLDDWVLQNAPHITLELCDAGMGFDDAIREMLEGLPSDALIVCHNVAFDLGLIEKHASDDLNRIVAGHRAFCTMKGTTDLCKLPSKSSRYGGQYKWPRLQELADHLTVDRSDTTAHDAIGDVELTRRCLARLAPRIPDLAACFNV